MAECHTIHSCHKDNINRAYCKIKNPFNLTLPHTYLPVTRIFTLRGMYTNDVPLSSSLNSARTPRGRRNSFPVGNTRIFRRLRMCLSVSVLAVLSFTNGCLCLPGKAFPYCRKGFPACRERLSRALIMPVWRCRKHCPVCRECA